MCIIYDIVYDKYYPAAPSEITIDLSKHPNESIHDIIKNVAGHFPTSYKLKWL